MAELHGRVQTRPQGNLLDANDDIVSFSDPDKFKRPRT